MILQGLASPSVDELVTLGFTDVGTEFDQYTLGNVQAQYALRSWLSTVHQKGLRAFAMVGSNERVWEVASFAAMFGFDYIEFDEFLSRGLMGIRSFQSLLLDLHGLYSKPILVTEFDEMALKRAIAIAQQQKGVMIASDQYGQVSSLDEIAQMSRNNVTVAAWVIFIPTEPLSDAYNNLTSWVVRAFELGLNVYFYAVTHDSTRWQIKWPLINQLLTARRSSLAIAIAKLVLSVGVIVMAALVMYSLSIQIVKRRKPRMLQFAIRPSYLRIRG